MKQKEVSLKSNIVYQIAYQILTLIVPLITSPYIARVLGKSGLGTYSYTYAIVNYFVLFAMLGLQNHGNREIAAKKENMEKCSQLFWNIFLIHIIVSVLSLLAYLAMVFLTFRENKLIAVIQSLFIVSAVFDISWLYFGLEKFRMTTTVSCVSKVITTLLIFLFVKEAADLPLYTIIIAGGTLFNNVVYWIFLKKNILFYKPNISSALGQLKPMIVLFIPVIAVSVYKYMDKIMLGSMMTTSDVGIYEAAEKFINLPMCVISGLGTVMLPRIANLKVRGNNKRIEQYNYISMMFVLFASIGMSFGLAGISQVFIPWFYGSEFAEASSILLILIPSIVFVSWANVIRTQCLLPNGRDKIFCISVIFGAILNFIVNALLIPRIGIAGTAIGTTVAEFVVCLVQTISVRQIMNVKCYLKDALPIVIAGLFMMAIISRIQLTNVVLTIVIRILVGLIVYTGFSSYFMRKCIQNYETWE